MAFPEPDTDTISVPTMAEQDTAPQTPQEGPFPEKKWGTVPASVTSRAVLTFSQAEQILIAKGGADIVSVVRPTAVVFCTSSGR
jgi:hypothetical protein